MYTAVPAVDDMQVCHAEGFRLFKQAAGRSGKVSLGTKELLFYIWWAKSGRYNRPFLDTKEGLFIDLSKAFDTVNNDSGASVRAQRSTMVNKIW